MKKMIVAGNKHYGLAKSIYEAHPDAAFYSRSNGNLDFTKFEDRKKFAIESLNYDICISCSYVPDFGQLNLVNHIWDRWQRANKKGHIIVIGSTADNSRGARMYCIEKRNLRDYCRNYGGGAVGGGPNVHPGNGIKITYVAPGVLNLPKQREKFDEKIGKIDTRYLVEVIDWLIAQPNNIAIHDISLDAVTT